MAIVMYRHYSLRPLTSSDIVQFHRRWRNRWRLEATRAITAHAFITSDTADRHAYGAPFVSKLILFRATNFQSDDLSVQRIYFQSDEFSEATNFQSDEF